MGLSNSSSCGFGSSLFFLIILRKALGILNWPPYFGSCSEVFLESAGVRWSSSSPIIASSGYKGSSLLSLISLNTFEKDLDGISDGDGMGEGGGELLSAVYSFLFPRFLKYSINSFSLFVF